MSELEPYRVGLPEGRRLRARGPDAMAGSRGFIRATAAEPKLSVEEKTILDEGRRWFIRGSNALNASMINGSTLVETFVDWFTERGHEHVDPRVVWEYDPGAPPSDHRPDSPATPLDQFLDHLFEVCDFYEMMLVNLADMVEWEEGRARELLLPFLKARLAVFNVRAYRLGCVPGYIRADGMITFQSREE